MESLEQQFTSVLAEIEVDGRPLTETEIVHSCVVNNDFAKFTIVLPLESRLRQILPTQIEENIRNLPPFTWTSTTEGKIPTITKVLPET